MLEHFVHDAANLPAEIHHLMEEIQAKDKIMQECRATINSRDGSIQKFIKFNGSLAPNPKEEQYSKSVVDNLDRSYELQDEKIKLSDKACVLLDRQIKRLDDRIRVLVNEGLLTNDPPLPNLSDTNQKTNPYRTLPRVFSDSNAAESTPSSDRKHLKSTSEKENPIVEAARHLVNRTGGSGAHSFPSDATATARASAPGTPAGMHSAHSQQEKEKAVDNKRLRLGQQPMGSTTSRPGSRPGTPKPGTPVPSRAGSVPPRLTSTSQRKIAPHHKVKQLKAASHQKRRKDSPSAGKRVKKVKRSPNGEGEEDEDSLLSSADMSDSDKSDAGADDDMDDDDEDDGIEDTKVYCTCRNVSHGDMVACDNDDCPYEWFHWKCVGLTREPTGTWYCDECRKNRS